VETEIAAWVHAGWELRVQACSASAYPAAAAAVEEEEAN
jgi:hypothetical protein